MSPYIRPLRQPNLPDSVATHYRNAETVIAIYATIAAFSIVTLLAQAELWMSRLWIAYVLGVLLFTLLANRQVLFGNPSARLSLALLIGQAAILLVLTVVSSYYFLTPMLSFVTVSISQSNLPTRLASFYDGVLLLALSLLIGSVQGWVMGIQFLLAMGAGYVFIIAFTRIAQSETQARQQLETTNIQLADYVAQVSQLATMRERTRLAREVHDSLGHYLVVINVQLEIVTKLVLSDPGRAHDAAVKAKEFAIEGLAEVRRSVAALRPSPLNDQPLVDAIHQLADDTRASGLAVSFEHVGMMRPLSPEIETVIYRAAQESLTNVCKHAHASSAEVKLAFNPTGVQLLIRDNGTGRPPHAASVGIGLAGLYERVKVLGGSVRAENDVRGGFVVEVNLPHDLDSADSR